MRTFKTYALLALAALGFAASASAQLPVGSAYDVALYTIGNKSYAVAPGVAADDQNVAILVRAIRSGYSFDVSTATAGHMKFYTDAAATHAVLDTTINVQSGGLATCGATPGDLDMTDADCDTVGELIDHINASANWRAVALDSRRSDVADGGTRFLLALTYTDAKAVDGIGVKWDTSVKLETLRALVPPAFRSINKYINPVSYDLVRQPFNGYRTSIFKLSQSSAFTTQPSLEVHGVLENLVTGQRSGSTVADNLYFSDVTAATGVNKVFDFTGGSFLLAGLDEKVVVRVTGASVFTTEKLSGYALFFEYPR